MKSGIKIKNIIITKLSGGLGNQMFQFSAAFSLANRLKATLYFDLSHFSDTIHRGSITCRKFELDCFKNIKCEVVTDEILDHFMSKESYVFNKNFNFFVPNTYTELTLDFDENLFRQKLPLHINGYWQSYKYFINNEFNIRQLFKFQQDLLDPLHVKILDEINNSNSLGIHVRRGDYLRPVNIDFHGYCSNEYYKRAIQLLLKRQSNVKIFYFSDDPIWVANNLLPLFPNSFIVSRPISDNSWSDMFLMSCCKHNIISNSSYSWWTAWLNSNNEKIIISPTRWYNNEVANSQTSSLIPESWIRI